MTNKFSVWQQIVSYFHPITVEKIKSHKSGSLSVVLSNGIIQLETEKVIYSQGLKYTSFKKAFEQINFNEHPIDNALILGGGLCSIPQMLTQTFKQPSNFDVVEFDEVIIDLCHKFLKDSLIQKCQFHRADAIDFVKKISSKYHLICIDLFIENMVPSQALQVSFLDKLITSLHSKGIIVFSLMESLQLNLSQINTYYNNLFAPKFSTSQVLQLKGNLVLIGYI